MKRTELKHDVSEVLEYLSLGHHAFVGCDSTALLKEFEERIRQSIEGAPVVVIDASELVSGEPFSNAMLAALKKLCRLIHKRLPKRLVTLSAYLTATMNFYSDQGRQGFLIINHIETLIQSQGNFEVEGTLRSAMQLQDDVAVVLCGPNKTIDLMGRSDRPFYLSFRIFRI